MAKVRSTPANGEVDTPPALLEEGENQETEEAPAPKPEVKKVKTPKEAEPETDTYVICNGEPPESDSVNFCKVRRDSPEELYDAIRSFVSEHDIKTEDVFIYSLGAQVQVKLSVSIEPA